jgi:hypothetical protein
VLSAWALVPWMSAPDCGRNDHRERADGDDEEDGMRRLAPRSRRSLDVPQADAHSVGIIRGAVADGHADLHEGELGRVGGDGGSVTAIVGKSQRATRRRASRCPFPRTSG